MGEPELYERGTRIGCRPQQSEGGKCHDVLQLAEGAPGSSGGCGSTAITNAKIAAAQKSTRREGDTRGPLHRIRMSAMCGKPFRLASALGGKPTARANAKMANVVGSVPCRFGAHALGMGRTSCFRKAAREERRHFLWDMLANAFLS